MNKSDQEKQNNQTNDNLKIEDDIIENDLLKPSKSIFKETNFGWQSPLIVIKEKS